MKAISYDMEIEMKNTQAICMISLAIIFLNTEVSFSKENKIDHIDRSEIKILSCKQDTVFYRKEEQNIYWGVMSKNGEIIIEANYNAIECKTDGNIWIPIDSKKQWCIFEIVSKKISDKCFEYKYSPSTSSTDYPVTVLDDKFYDSILWTKNALLYASGLTDDIKNMCTNESATYRHIFSLAKKKYKCNN